MYRGYRFDSETGLYYLQSRYYNPDWGRFVNADAEGGKVGELLSHNVFAYCGNNPVNRFDPDGRVWFVLPLFTALVRAAIAVAPMVVAVVSRVVQATQSVVQRVGPAVSRASQTKAIQTYLPPNDGFLGKATKTTLKPGTLIDRYGYPGGRFASPIGTPAEMRALPPGTLTKPYNVYEVVKPIDVMSGQIAPWFGQPGLGTQYVFSQKIINLLAPESGALRKVGP